MVDTARAQREAGLTGNESNEILAGQGARDLLDNATFRGAIAAVGAYYSQKQLDAGANATEVMRYQAQRVALQDLELTLRSYLETGELAKRRMSLFRRILDRMGRPRSRLDRFTPKRRDDD